MGAEVYANGMEVSGKASPHQVIASMPDVCLSPPSPPAGPVPIPYPNFAQASDTADGSKTVLIGGKEVSLKGASTYKKSKGDEAATRTFGGGVISHNITGPVKHKAGSFDVKIEGCGAVRHLDLTTGNHVNAGNGDASPGIAKPAAPSSDPECEELKNENESARSDLDARSKDKSVVGHDENGGGTTVSSMKSSSLGAQSAHNNQKAQKRLDTLAPGGDAAVRSGEKTPLCKGSEYKHPDPAMQKSGHAEARLMVAMSSSPPSSITVNIDWRPKSGGASKMPCPDCHKMLCAAAKDCKHEISLCDKQCNKKPLDCPGGPPDSQVKSYSRLKESMGEVELD